MSDTTGISATVPSTTSTMTTTTASAGGLKGTTDEFLKLFMAQMQQQDPFNPTSNSDMVAQLAQMSATEAAQTTNSQLGEILGAQQSEASAGLSSLIGRNCNATAGSFGISTEGGSPPPLELTSAAATKGASVNITDANGKVIRKLPIADGTTSTQIQWDGKDDSGKPVPPGNYKVQVVGGTGGTPTASWQGAVQAVELTPDGPRLRMGDVLIAPSDVTTIGNNTTTAASSATTLAAKINRVLNGAKKS